jgi:hypothetical protein
MPDDENALNDTLAQALKLLDGDEKVVEPAPEKVEPKVEPTEPIVATEPVVPTEPQAEPDEKEEPENEAESLPHGESSRLGRKVKRMEDTFAEAMAKIEALTNAIGRSPMAQPEVVELESDEMPEIITTPEDVQKVIDIRDRKKTMEAQKERTAYFGRFESHKSEDPDLYDEVYQEMLKNHNIKTTGKPDIDADINYLKAKNAILSKKLATESKPKPNALGKAPPPANVPAAAPVVARQLNLSADEKAAAEAFGFNDDELQRILAK